jgi:hypothetical protein
MRDDITMPNDSVATMDPNAATHAGRLTNQGYIVRRDIYSVDVAVPIQPYIIGNVILCDWIVTTDHSFSFVY